MKKQFVLIKNHHSKIINCITSIIAISLFVSCTHTEKKTHTSIIEIVGIDTISHQKLKALDLQATLYQWKNHLVVFGVFQDVAEMYKQIAAIYPEASVRLYEQPFYIFDRRQCDKASYSERWSHTLMTANLVADTVLQEEYMDYHDRQAELFPEVARGFCRADFQQLLLFRNGRQLMLVISIPEGENLDDLNPKTTENNPRVDEWNMLMAKYQEGIEGTAPEETWVVLEER